MNTLSRNKTLLTIIAILLLTNITMLIFLLRCDKPEPPKRVGFTERLKKEVGFTPQQMAVFEPKKKIHWDTMRSKFEQIK
ncbi:MAG: hypothetical protein J7497_11990, partial [Chitinophagaceae bacterium]|nr:hypothetical protein [Chitinophagaceae bacterium]